MIKNNATEYYLSRYSNFYHKKKKIKKNSGGVPKMPNHNAVLP